MDRTCDDGLIVLTLKIGGGTTVDCYCVKFLEPESSKVIAELCATIGATC